ncbi:MAG: tail fiber domain-containing protein [Flavobacteriales bacterium]|nr:tail fiber domain-containing protein [Flavobacteriales bacterium]MBK9700906.1 tail fiber domain-containing protein [Flavobacteriales bacterium]
MEVRHNGNQPIQWWTDSIQRMQLYHTRTGTLQLLGGGSINVQQDGYLGLSGTPGFFATNGYGPFSRLHLADLDPNSEGQNHYNQPWGYRSWMKNGVTLTGNHDHAYIGQRYYGHDSTDLVIHWSDNAEKSPFGPDRLRFIFTTDNTGATQGSRSQEGLEFMRMYPVNQNQGFVGIGDFARPGISPDPEPSERLDILDQTIRIRRLVPDYEDDQLDRLVVTDANGRLHWRDVSSLPAPPDNCEWTMGVNPNPNHVWTAVGPADPDCPDGEDNVGIGTNSLVGGTKLNVIENTPHASLSNRGIFVRTEIPAGSSGAGATCVGARAEAANAATNVGLLGAAISSNTLSAGINYGIEGTATASGTVTNNHGGHFTAATASGVAVTANRGVFSRATNNAASALNWGGQFEAYSAGTSASNRGVESYVQGDGTAQTNFGLRSYLWCPGGSSANFGVWSRVDAPSSSNNIAVYGAVPDTLANNWAGFFQGRVQVTGSMWNNGTYIFSDADIKTNVEDIEGPTAADLLGQLMPRSYNYQSAQYPQLYLPGGEQYGFLAQEVAQVIPAVVSSTTVPEEVDSLGQVIHPEMDVEGINYTAMIPLLVAGFKEQQATISSLQDQLAAVQQDLASCCAAHGEPDQRSMNPGAGGAGAAEVLRTDLFILPNPVADLTQLRYTVAVPGRARLEVSDAHGKRLEVLEEAVREVGTYTRDWTTTDLAPGTYHCTLYLNDSFVVKKAVKVAR